MTKSTGRADKPVMRFLPLAVILLAALAGAVFLRDFLSFDQLAQNRAALEAFRDANYLMAVLVFMAAYVAIVGFSLPGATLTTLTGGFLFGTFPGVLFNVTAATLGATLIFLAVRAGFGERLKGKMQASDGAWRKIVAQLDENQWSILFFIRLVPAIPFFVANLLPGMVGVPLHRYVISTFFGILPGGLVFTSIGAGMGALLDRGETPDLSVVTDPAILLPLLGLAALSLLPVALRRLKGAS